MRADKLGEFVQMLKEGLWTADASSNTAVMDLMNSCPFCTCGLRQNIEDLHGSKALNEKMLT